MASNDLLKVLIAFLREKLLFSKIWVEHQFAYKKWAGSQTLCSIADAEKSFLLHRVKLLYSCFSLMLETSIIC